MFKFSEEKINNLTSEKLQNKMETFKSTMEETFKSKDLKYMNDNLETLRIFILKSKLLQYPYKAMYNNSSNELMILEEDDTIYHELLHLSCNNRKNKNTIRGFAHYTKKQKNILSFGTGLDEVYTEILANRLFDKEIEIITNKTLELVLLLEQLIDDLPSLYLNSDLYELVLELSKYTNINESLEFIYNIDRLYTLEQNIKNHDKYNEIYSKTLYFLKKYQYKRNYQQQKNKKLNKKSN